jgi:hypothetical protein
MVCFQRSLVRSSTRVASASSTSSFLAASGLGSAGAARARLRTTGSGAVGGAGVGVVHSLSRGLTEAQRRPAPNRVARPHESIGGPARCLSQLAGVRYALLPSQTLGAPAIRRAACDLEQRRWQNSGTRIPRFPRLTAAGNCVHGEPGSRGSLGKAALPPAQPPPCHQWIVWQGVSARQLHTVCTSGP